MSEMAVARGRGDRRQAILDAALATFAREGYAGSSVEDIAAAARVAKATVYSHFRDKEHLFHSTVTTAAEDVLADHLAVIDQLSGDGHQTRTNLEQIGHHLLRCYCAERARALRRLMSAEAPRPPGLFDTVQGRVTERVIEALAGRFARLTIAGHLSTADPLLAAEQFLGLLTGPIDHRSLGGSRPLPDGELRDVAVAAVSTFLRAFATDPGARR